MARKMMALALALLVAAAGAVELPAGPITPTLAPITFSDAATLASVSEDAAGGVAPTRVLPVQAIKSTRIPVKLSSRGPVPEDIPAGTPFAGEYIVLYKEDVVDVQAAAESARTAAIQLTAAAAQGGQLALAVGSDIASHVTVLATNPTPAGIPSQAVIKVPSELQPAAVKAALGAAPGVKAVVANRVVRIAQAIPEGGCTPGYYASAVEARPAAGFAWEGCAGEGVGLAAFGERCGAGLDKFRWSGLFAYSKATGAMLANCVAFRGGEANAARRAELFGSCGVAPTKLQGLPTHACSETDSAMPLSDACVAAGSLSAYSVQLSSSLCAAQGEGATVSLAGVPCGPNNSLIQWEALNVAACGAAISRAGLDPKQAADWVGACGVPPLQISGLPTRICGASPPRARPAAVDAAAADAPVAADTAAAAVGGPSPLAIARTPLKGGESGATWGMSRIGALAGGRVLDGAAGFGPAGPRVIVMDTGVERGHPDLNVIEFVDFYDTPGASDYGVDGHGHGTHVGGIIGARNQGSGVAGVVPGIPLIAFKVLGSDGSGSLDNIYVAYAEIAKRQARGDRIAAINLSLGSPVMDADGLKVECDWVKKLASYGTAIVAAAGNDGGELLTGTMPSACPDALSVTSIASDDSPSYFSNLAELSSPAYVRDKTVAAPGSSIYSTYHGGGYLTLSGTSMATPHATGVVMACFLAGDCKLGGGSSTTGVIPKIQASAKAVGCANRNKCGPSWGSSKFYGHAISVRNW